MSKKIALTQGRYTIIDSIDFEWLNQYRWQVDSDGYAVRRMLKGEGHRNGKIRMPRFIVNPPKGMVVDHINGNKLDNRRENLRVCTQAENARNRKVTKRNKCGYKGIYWVERDKRWKGYIHVKGKGLHLGYFKTLLEGAQAYDQAALKYFKEFAHLNFPKQ